MKTARIASIIILCLLSSMVFAAKYKHRPFNGFHIDIGGGGVNATSYLTQTQTFSIIGLTNVMYHEPDAVKNSFLGLIGLGYGATVYQRYFLGAKLTGDIQSTQITKYYSLRDTIGLSEMTSSILVNLKYSFALLFTPGYLLDSRTLVYILIGPRWGYFNTAYNSNVSFPIISANGVLTQSDSFYATGFNIGIGLSRYITQHLVASVEYNSTNYGRISSANLSTPLTIDDETLGTLGYLGSINPRTSALTLALSYYFG